MARRTRAKVTHSSSSTAGEDSFRQRARVKTQLDPAEAEKAGASVSALKDQLALLGLVVVFVGLVSTETYYASFGLRYQDLGLSATHLLYRGFTTLLGAWYLAALYLSAIAWLASSDAVSARLGRERTLMVGYLVVAILVIAGYPLVRKAGLTEARQDMLRDSSTLPTIDCLAFAKGVCDPEFRRYKYLVSTDWELLVFQPIGPTQPSTYPIIVHLPHGDIHELRTSPSR